MLTAKVLLENTPEKVRKRTSSPRIRIIKDDLDSAKRKVNYRTIYTRTSLGNDQSSGDSYTLVIRNHGTKANPTNLKFNANSQIWCHCSCPYFTYYLEVALTLYKSSSFYNTNRKLPKIRNPKLVPYLCKHLHITLLNLIKRDR